MRQRGVFGLFVHQNVCDLIVEVRFSGAGLGCLAFTIGSCSSSVASAHGEPSASPSVIHAFELPEANQEQPWGDGRFRAAPGLEFSLLRGTSVV